MPAKIQGFAAYAPESAGASDGFRPEYFAQLSRLEAGNFWFRIRNDLIVATVLRHFPHASKAMEIGCGTGFVLAALSKALPAAAFVGSEIYPEGLHFAASRLPAATFCQMDARAIPFHDEFDLVGAFDVVEHIQQDTEVLAQVHKALKRGGGFVLTVPQHMFLWSQQDAAACHVRRYARGELESKLRGAGFRVVSSTSFVSLLFPLLLASRLLKRGRRADYDPTVEFRIPSWANAMLLAVSKVEATLIMAGVRFPFGGTRLVAAVKE
jgi:SAM-dependent methyltransferase